MGGCCGKRKVGAVSAEQQPGLHSRAIETPPPSESLGEPKSASTQHSDPLLAAPSSGDSSGASSSAESAASASRSDAATLASEATTVRGTRTTPPTPGTEKTEARTKSVSEILVASEGVGDGGCHTSVREFRILLPLSAAEFEKAQIYACTVGSRQVTGGGSGVDFRAQEPFTAASPNNPPRGLPGNAGVYTKKTYHLQPIIPRPVRALLSDELMTMHEEAWNAYPLCKTLITNAKWDRGDLEIQIRSLHVDGDDGRLPNALRLPPETLALRDVVFIDITDDAVLGAKNYRPDEDPKKVRAKDGRGPWLPGWEKTAKTKMCIYKVLSFRLRWRLLEGRLRVAGLGTYPGVFAKFHRLAVCSIDVWSRRSLAELRAEERKLKDELQKLRASADYKGPKAD